MCRHVDMQYVAHFNGSVQNTDKSQAQTANINQSAILGIRSHLTMGLSQGKTTEIISNNRIFKAFT